MIEFFAIAAAGLFYAGVRFERRRGEAKRQQLPPATARRLVSHYRNNRADLTFIRAGRSSCAPQQPPRALGTDLSGRGDR